MRLRPPGARWTIHVTMTIRIDAIHMTPVKSLALVSAGRARVTRGGIAGDRAFFIVDDAGKLVTQREEPRLVMIAPAYDPASGVLEMRFPDGTTISEPPEDTGDEVSARFHGVTDVPGAVTGARFGEALSVFAGRPLRLVRARHRAFDALPLSICSRASLAALSEVAGTDVDARRFRQNIWLGGATAHEEDAWLGSDVRIGGIVARIVMRDSRCVMTTQNPDSGATDLNTLNLIASYRTDQPKEVNFGVYAGVIEAGEIAVGDEVAPSVTA